MKLLSTLFPQDEFIGIHIGYQNTYMTVGRCCSSGVKVEWQKVFVNAETVSFNENEFSKYLENIISSLPKEFKKRYLPVQIALPDLLFKTQKLKFSNFPRGYKEQSTLINWQLAKTSHCIAEQIYTTWQSLGKTNGEQSVFAYGVDKNIIATLKDVLHKVGLHVSSINAASYYRYNILHASALCKSGVLLALEKDYWSLMFWDETGDLNHIHTAIRESNMHDDIFDIVAETERLVLSYIQNDKSIENIYITAIGEEKELLETQINQRLENKCKWLSIPGVSNVKFNDSGIVDLATIIKL
jgi:hypothetical protein